MVYNWFSACGEEMTKEDLVSVLIITMNCFWLGTWLDQKFLLRKRFLNKSYEEATKKGRCPICERPIKVISDTGSEPELK